MAASLTLKFKMLFINPSTQYLNMTENQTISLLPSQTYPQFVFYCVVTVNDTDLLTCKIPIK